MCGGRTYRLPLLLEQTSGGTESDRLGCCRGDDVALVFTDGFPSRSTFGRRRSISAAAAPRLSRSRMAAFPSCAAAVANAPAAALKSAISAAGVKHAGVL